MSSLRPLVSVAVAAAVLLGASGCTKTFNVRPVSPPYAGLEATSQPGASSLGIRDVRGAKEKPLNFGTLKVVTRGMTDEMGYLAANLANALRAQGISITTTPDGSGDLVLDVRTFRIRNLRTSGYSPYHSFTTFAADLHHEGKTSRITAYFKGSKTPVWSFNEVERPCYQIPVEAVVREVAAKINAHVFGRRASDERVQALAAAISSRPSDSGSEEYLKVLELGYTNSPAAVGPLVALTERKETLMRAAAVSSLGMLRATEQLPLLERIYAENTHVVKAMALKSIGDLETPESRAFLDRIRQSKDYREPTLKEVIDLYY